VQGLEDGARVAARPGGRAHAVHQQRVRRLAGSGVEAELVRANALERHAAAVELGEEWLEPEWVLVEDPDRLDEQENVRPRAAIPLSG
jgi:hypothetical protein